MIENTGRKFMEEKMDDKRFVVHGCGLSFGIYDTVDKNWVVYGISKTRAQKRAQKLNNRICDEVSERSTNKG